MTKHLHLWVQEADYIPRCSTCGRKAHASPSQIENWGRLQGDDTRTGCRRKWAYRRRRPRVQAKAAAFGTRTHDILENWLKAGTWTPTIAQAPEGKCLAAGLHLFAPPGEAMAEREVHVDLMGIHWIMKVDALSHYQPGYTVRVSDLKTTGNLDNAATPESLLEDPQRLAYAYWATTTLEVEYSEARWVYCRRKPPKAIPVSVVEHRDHTAQRFARMIENDVRPMVAANVVPLDAFPRDGVTNGYCQKYGGCEFREECLVDQNPIDLLNARLVR